MTEESLYHVKDAVVKLRVFGSEIEHCRVCSSPSVRDTSGLESRNKARYGTKREKEREWAMERERERERGKGRENELAQM